MAEIVADIAIHRRISCYSVGLKMLCLMGVNLEDLVENYPLCTMAPVYLLTANFWAYRGGEKKEREKKTSTAVYISRKQSSGFNSSIIYQYTQYSTRSHRGNDQFRNIIQ